MEIKPSKSRSISIIKGQIVNERFYINDEPIPTILEKPIKSLGRWYNTDLKDAKQVEQLKQDTISGLKQINSTALPGKLKLWCLQFGLLPRLMWPISMYEVTLSHANRLERLVNVQVRKWLGQPRCLRTVRQWSPLSTNLKPGGGVQVLESKARNDPHRIPGSLRQGGGGGQV